MSDLAPSQRGCPFLDALLQESKANKSALRDGLRSQQTSVEASNTFRVTMETAENSKDFCLVHRKFPVLVCGQHGQYLDAQDEFEQLPVELLHFPGELALSEDLNHETPELKVI